MRKAMGLSTALIIVSSFNFIRLLLATDECSLYIAPSSRSTEDTFLLGVFAGVDYQPGDRIGPSDVAIPIIDVEFHNSHRIMSEDDMPSDTTLLPKNFFDPIAQVLWTPQNTGAHMEIYGDSGTEGSNVIVSIPGIGLLARDSPYIMNADFNQAWILNRTLTVDGLEQAEISHPGRGAYTQYSPIVIEAQRYIPAGSEIFISYGIKYDNPIPFEEVDKSLTKIHTFFSNYPDQLTPSQQQTLYSFFVQDIIPYSGSKTSQRQADMVEAFPTHVDEISSVLQKEGGSFIYQNPEAMKPVSWLNTHGQCMDGLYPGISSIPHVGRGAFAKRAVRAGQVISPMPLLKIDDKSWLDMYQRDVSYNDDGEPYSIREDLENPSVIHKQLLLNYCYGHPESSILLHPVGSVVNMINHKQNDKGANAQIVWSNHSHYNQGWLNMSVEELKELSGYGIGFDLIATRDIQADEEVFLDYGIEWDTAWRRHLESWQDDTWPFKALDWNQDITHSTFFTTDEREELVSSTDSDPYPDNIETVCQVVWIEEEQPDGSILLTFDSNVGYQKLWIGANMFRCDIIHRDVVEGGDWENLDDYFYTVYLRPNGETVGKVPHNCIRFQDKAYTSDMHVSETFRHPIGIPDSIFPDAWRNLQLYS